MDFHMLLKVGIKSIVEITQISLPLFYVLIFTLKYPQT